MIKERISELEDKWVEIIRRVEHRKKLVRGTEPQGTAGLERKGHAESAGKEGEGDRTRLQKRCPDSPTRAKTHVYGFEPLGAARSGMSETRDGRS